MKKINVAAKKILEALVVAMGTKTSARIGEKGRAIMPVYLEVIAPGRLSVTHYYEQNGDLMRDPEMIFFRGADGEYYPIYFRQDNMGIEVESGIIGASGQIEGVRPRAQADHAVFANTWLRNIKAQHGPVFVCAVEKDETAVAS